jgi:hypothetical protein
LPLSNRERNKLIRTLQLSVFVQKALWTELVSVGVDLEIKEISLIHQTPYLFVIKNNRDLRHHARSFLYRKSIDHNVLGGFVPNVLRNQVRYALDFLKNN